MPNSPAHHPSFKFIREQKVESLNVLVQEFEHIKTGASHIHLQADSEENVFLVALRTVPHDSTGVAHILEHTALCGSKKYPVRDPFFMMTRRSLNTFMNAFTSSDWTAYPFASMNKKDFNNLLDVYLDAVFFSRLDKLDFAQEGHRLEFAEPNNPESELQFKGVVYNEMKGAMSSVSSQLWHTLCKYVFPTTTYHYNSGGEPECIPDLTYEELVEFYQTHYHPSNAIFMTFGDIPAETHQTKFEDQALKEFDRLDHVISVPDEKRYHAPIRVQESYPYNDGEATCKTHVVLGWLLGKSTDLEETLRAQLLTSILLDNSATPLMHALESTDLGTSPSQLCGLDDSQKELTFLCGLAGCDDAASDQVEKLILDTLNKVAEEGLPLSEIESALHQLELQQREIGGDSYPYGLQLILTSLTSATHRGDPVKLLNIDPVLDQLREEIKDPNWAQTLVKKYLLENKHRVRLTMTPDSQMSAQKEDAEKQLLASIKTSLTEQQTQAIVEQAEALKTRQAQEDDETILPKVTLADVPESEKNVTGTTANVNGHKVTRYSAGTNGLVYQQAIFEIPAGKPELLDHLRLYSNLMNELGVGDKSYLDMQRLQASVCGGFYGFSNIRNYVDDRNKNNAYYIYSGKALNRNQKALTELMANTIKSLRFDELSRIKEVISQINNSNEQRVTGNGHGLAMAAAKSGLCGTALHTHNQTGLAGYKSFRDLTNAIDDPQSLEKLADQLADLHSHLTTGASQFLLIGEEANLDAFSQAFEHFSLAPTANLDMLNFDPVNKKVKEAWVTNSQVNFCAQVFPTVTMAHEDSAPLVVLGGFLRNGFLHTAIREQGGAYGGGASQDNQTGAFSFYSYRDPRLEDTYKDFGRAVEWLLTTEHSSQKLEEAILGAVSSLDSSESPAGQAKRCFYSELNGRTVALRQQFRERLLATEIGDLKRVAETYLKPELANDAVVTSAANRSLVDALGFAIKEY